MGTQGRLANSLERTVFLYDGVTDTLLAEAIGHFNASHVVIVDGIDWPGMADIQAGLIPEQRKFKSSFHPDVIPNPEITWRGMDLMVAACTDLFERMFPKQLGPRHSSLRPMITGPEPMHFDSYAVKPTVLTSFINIAPTPRRYRFGPTFAALLAEQPDAMRAIVKKCTDLGSISYEIRENTAKDQLPLPSSAAAHVVEFAPGTMWFFNGKTASHEVVYGEGAMGISWELINSPAQTQLDLIKILE